MTIKARASSLSGSLARMREDLKPVCIPIGFGQTSGTATLTALHTSVNAAVEKVGMNNRQGDAMKLLTQEVLHEFERQGYTGDKNLEDIRIIFKVLNPCGGQTWYLYEYDPCDRIFMGFVNLGDPTFAECGAVSLDELEKVKVPPLGLRLERDICFGYGHTLEEVIAKVKNGGHI